MVPGEASYFHYAFMVEATVVRARPVSDRDERVLQIAEARHLLGSRGNRHEDLSPQRTVPQ
jgi:hypothetical protein